MNPIVKVEADAVAVVMDRKIAEALCAVLGQVGYTDIVSSVFNALADRVEWENWDVTFSEDVIRLKERAE